MAVFMYDMYISGKPAVIYDNHRYIQHCAPNNNHTAMRCAHQKLTKCRGRIYISNTEPRTLINVIQDYTCGRELCDAEIKVFMAEMKMKVCFL